MGIYKVECPGQSRKPTIFFSLEDLVVGTVKSIWFLFFIVVIPLALPCFPQLVRDGRRH